MLGPTHANGAIAAAVVVSAAVGLDPLQAITFTVTSAVAAYLPDKDRLVDSGPNHRSLTHSFAFGLGISYVLVAYVRPRVVEIGPALGSRLGDRLGELPVLGALVGGTFASGFASAAGEWVASLVLIAALGAALGYLSHLLLDALTPAGVWILLPGGPRLCLPVVRKVGNATESLINRGFQVVTALGAVAVLYQFSSRFGFDSGSLTDLMRSVLGIVLSNLKEVAT